MPLIVELIDETGEVDVDSIADILTWAFANHDGAPVGAWECSVRVAGPGVISALHGEFFGDPTDTDVMSFPSGEALESAAGYLGDIAISAHTAKQQAQDAGHSLTRELAYLALHGLLHLLGYDDRREDERNAMLVLQESLLVSAEQAMGSRL